MPLLPGGVRQRARLRALTEPGGLIAFSRILSDRDITVVANCSTHHRFNGLILQDLDLNRRPRQMTVRRRRHWHPGFRNRPPSPAREVPHRGRDGHRHQRCGALFLGFNPMEVQILVPS
jgi:hypothetical protein